MAQAQEFSSPGAHMASTRSSISGGSGRSIIPNGTIGKVGAPTSNIIYAPRSNNENLNYWKDAELNPRINYYDDGTFGYDERSVNNYLKPYIKYNEDLFTRAQDYDMMMSNTSIRRQMQDLKAAGINPILAGRLGGAQYKGVSAPYVTINPAGALSAFATFQGNNLNYDARMREIASREKVSQNELFNRMEIAEKQISKDLKVAGLNAENLYKIAEMNNLTDKETTAMINEVKVYVQQMYNDVMEKMNSDNIDNQSEMNKNNNIRGYISQALSTIGLLVAAKINSSRRSPFLNYALPGFVGFEQYKNMGLFDLNTRKGGYQ